MPSPRASTAVVKKPGSFRKHSNPKRPSRPSQLRDTHTLGTHFSAARYVRIGARRGEPARGRGRSGTSMCSTLPVDVGSEKLGHYLPEVEANGLYRYMAVQRVVFCPANGAFEKQ